MLKQNKLSGMRVIAIVMSIALIFAMIPQLSMNVYADDSQNSGSSIELTSTKYDWENNEAGSHKTTKSVKWTNKEAGLAEITFTTETNLGYAKDYNILVMMANGGSLSTNNQKKCRRAIEELANKVLVNNQNTFSLFTFNSTNTAHFFKKTDKDYISNEINKISDPAGNTWCDKAYKALYDSRAAFYGVKPLYVLVMSDRFTYENSKTGEAETQGYYQAIKSDKDIPDSTIDALGLHISQNQKEFMKSITDNQYESKFNDFTDTMIDSVAKKLTKAATYDEFILTDNVNITNFDVEGTECSGGTASIDNMGKLSWNLNGFASGETATLTVKVKLKDGTPRQKSYETGTGTTEVVRFKGGETDVISRNISPVLEGFEDEQTDQKAADAVIALINELPDADKLTLDDKGKVNEAKAAYEDLTDTQKALINEDIKAKLEAAKAKIAELEAAAQAAEEDKKAANAVANMIGALTRVEKLTLDDKEDVDAAEAAYDALTDTQKALINAAVKEKLEDAVKKIKELEDAAQAEKTDQEAADAVTDKINALPDADKLTLDDKGKVNEAKAAYEKLTEKQKTLISEETKAKLDIAVAKINILEKGLTDQEAADEAKKLITAIPDTDKLTLADKEKVDAAKAMYDALTDDQKALIDDATKKKLDDAVAKIRELEANAAAEEAAGKTEEAEKEVEEVKDGDTEEDLDKADKALKEAQEALAKLEKAKEAAEKALADAIAKFGEGSPEALAAKAALDKIIEQIAKTSNIINWITRIKEEIQERIEAAEQISIQDVAVVLSATEFTYNGKVKMPIIRTVGGMTLADGTDYTLKIENSKGELITSPKAAGTYTLHLTGTGKYTGMTKVSYKINKAANPLKVKGKTVKIKHKKLKKKTHTHKVSKVIKFHKKGKGKMHHKKVSVTYTKAKKVKMSKKALKKYKKTIATKIKINTKTGKVTVKKGLKKGTYKVKVKIKAAGNANYKASKWKTVTFKIKVR